jgi:hypothetical protein
MTTDEPARDRPGEHGPAARDGIVDQQDAVLHEIADDDRPDNEGVNDTERRFGESESPA